MKRDILATSGDRSLVLIDDVATIEERGVVIVTEEDGDEFHHYLGVYFGWQVELAMAVGAYRGSADSGGRPDVQPVPHRDEGGDPARKPAEQDDDDGVPF